MKIRGHEIALGFLLGTGFGFVVFALASVPSAYGEICDEPQQGQTSADKNCATYHIVFVMLWHVAKALKTYDSAINAFATVVIAVFTITLWVSTHRMWKASEGWPAPGSEDTELGVLMGPEVRHGASEVHARVQA